MTDVAKRNRRNKAAGQRWQRELLVGLRDHGLDTERLALAGAEDEGDHVVRLSSSPRRYVVIEAKAGEMHAAEFVRQAAVEASNFASHRGLDRSAVKGVAVVKRRGANWKDAYVLTTVRDYFGLGDA